VESISASILGWLNVDTKERGKRISDCDAAWVTAWNGKLNSVARYLYRATIFRKKLPIKFHDKGSNEKAVNSKLRAVFIEIKEKSRDNLRSYTRQRTRYVFLLEEAGNKIFPFTNFRHDPQVLQD
jgi:hypothetical protein